ncbi:HAD-like domain-containing protein [Cunninghamella echinulata]|nr:HAD-like domain-containing protein [Cunninghamella echinulata]
MKSQIKALLIDLSGTIHIDSKVIPGAIEAIEKLRTNNIPFKFATNTTKVSSKKLVEKLNNIGFNISPNEVFTSLSACHDLIKAKNLRPLLFMEEDALEEFKDIKTENENAVVVGLAPSNFHYAKMNQAFRLMIQNPDIPLIAVHKAKYFADKDEELSLGPGPFVTALEYAAGTTATIVGKPTKSFFELALKQIGFENNPGSVAIIGDDVNSDLGDGAEKLGLHRILVRTGKYRQGDENKLTGDKTYVFDSVTHAINEIISSNK